MERWGEKGEEDNGGGGGEGGNRKKRNDERGREAREKKADRNIETNQIVI